MLGYRAHSEAGLQVLVAVWMLVQSSLDAGPHCADISGPSLPFTPAVNLTLSLLARPGLVLYEDDAKDWDVRVGQTEGP